MTVHYSPVLGWSEEAFGTCFDAVDAPWYKMGGGQAVPMFPIKSRGKSVWDDPDSETTINYQGRQRPMVAATSYLMSGLPIYQALGAKSLLEEVWTFSPLAYTAGTLPEFHLRYQEAVTASTTVIIHQLYNKTQSLQLKVDREWPMVATQVCMGRHMHISPNTTLEDGTTDSTSLYTSLMNSPTEYDAANHAITSGFVLDNRSEVTINSVDITDSLLSARATISIAPRYGYQSESTYRAAIWPNVIIERPPPIPMGLSFDVLGGVDNDTLKTVFSATGYTVSAKFYDATTNYIQLYATSADFNEYYYKGTGFQDVEDRVSRVTVMCPYNTSVVKVKDGVTAIT